MSSGREGKDWKLVFFLGWNIVGLSKSTVIASCSNLPFHFALLCVYLENLLFRAVLDLSIVIVSKFSFCIFSFVLMTVCLVQLRFKWCWMDRNGESAPQAQQLLTLVDHYNYHGQLAPSEAQGGAAPCGWRWGAGASANKSPTSEISAANKHTEAARDALAFLGHQATILINSLSYTVRCGKLFVSVQRWCAKHHWMTDAPASNLKWNSNPCNDTCKLHFLCSLCYY